MPKPARSKGPLWRIVLVVVLVVIVLAVKPARVAYHHSAMRTAWITTLGGGTNIDQIATFEKHREALVGLGALKRERFELAMKPGSPAHTALSIALNEHAKTHFGFFALQGYETNAQAIATVWAPPASLSDWEKLVRSYDSPKESK